MCLCVHVFLSSISLSLSLSQGVVPHPLVKCIPPKFDMSKVEDLFALLVPPEISAAVEEYKERVKQIISVQKEKVSNFNNEAKSFLLSQNLPASIDAGESASGLPDSVWVRIEAIQRLGGVKWLQSSLSTSTGLKSDVSKTLAKVQTIILEEEKDDSDCKSTYGSRWNRNTSESLNVSFMEAMSRYSHLLDEASKPDVLIDARMKELASTGQLNILSKTRKEIDSLVPSTSTKAKSNSPERVNLVQSLSQLDTLINEREILSRSLEGILER